MSFEEGRPFFQEIFRPKVIPGNAVLEQGYMVRFGLTGIRTRRCFYGMAPGPGAVALPDTVV
jgi:hypothetical protein